jgi:hypothetical protein
VIRETEEHRRMERDSFDRLEVPWKGKILQTPFGAPLDGILVREHIDAVIEHKCRYEDYPTTWLSLRKFIYLVTTAEHLCARPLFVVRYPHPAELWWIDVRELRKPLTPIMMGRHDRPEQDHEPALVIPFRDMNKVKL